MNKLVVYADTTEAGCYQRFDNPVTRTGVYALDINGSSLAMHRQSRTFVRKLIVHGAIRAIKLERNVRNRASRLQTLHKAFVHVLQRAGRNALSKFSFAEVRKLTAFHPDPLLQQHAPSAAS